MPVTSTASLKKGSQTVLGAYRGATPAYNALGFYRNFAQLKSLNHGIGPAITFTRGSNATYFNAAGVLTTATTNEPRFDHNPSSGNASLGLLIEEARTNLLTSSKTFSGFSGGGWTSVTDDHSISPNGTTTASLFEWSVVENSYKFGETTLTSTAAATYTTTAFVKPVSGTGVVGVRVGRNDSSQFVESRLNLQTNANTMHTIGADVSGASVSAQNVGNGWYRLSATGTFSNSYANFGAQLNAVSGSGSFLVWGVQLEAGAFPTSYIPTTTAAATRAADSAVVTPISSFYNQAEGTFLAEAVYSGKAPGVFSRIFSIGNTTAGDPDRWFWGFNNANTDHLIQHFTAGVFDFGTSFATSAGTVYKVASAIALNNARAAQNGSLLGSDDTSVGAPGNKTHMVIGGSPTSVAGIALHFRKVAYWPKRLTNTLLEQLTT